jgi:hypothetical protein
MPLVPLTSSMRHAKKWLLRTPGKRACAPPLSACSPVHVLGAEGHEGDDNESLQDSAAAPSPSPPIAHSSSTHSAASIRRRMRMCYGRSGRRGAAAGAPCQPSANASQRMPAAEMNRHPQSHDRSLQMRWRSRMQPARVSPARATSQTAACPRSARL